MQHVAKAYNATELTYPWARRLWGLSSALLAALLLAVCIVGTLKTARACELKHQLVHYQESVATVSSAIGDTAESGALGNRASENGASENQASENRASGNGAPGKLTTGEGSTENTSTGDDREAPTGETSDGEDGDSADEEPDEEPGLVNILVMSTPNWTTSHGIVFGQDTPRDGVSAVLERPPRS